MPGRMATLEASSVRTAEEVWIEGLRAAPSWRKAEMVRSLNAAVEELALAGLRLRHPVADLPELRLRLAALRLPRETMIRVFGWDPATHGY